MIYKNDLDILENVHLIIMVNNTCKFIYYLFMIILLLCIIIPVVLVSSRVKDLNNRYNNECKCKLLHWAETSSNCPLSSSDSCHLAFINTSITCYDDFKSNSTIYHSCDLGMVTTLDFSQVCFISQDKSDIVFQQFSFSNVDACAYGIPFIVVGSVAFFIFSFFSLSIFKKKSI
jgi:hypothetical protein